VFITTNKLPLLFILMSYCFTSTSLAVSKETLNIAFLSADQLQIATLSRWVNAFELEHPGIEIDLRSFSDANYKQNFKTWLANGSFDIMYWQAGKRLEDIVSQGLVNPVENILSQQQLTIQFPESALRQVRYNNLIQAIPIAQYTWGFYYNKKVFNQFQLSPPTSWAEFINLCETLRNNGIQPLVQANKDGWEPLIWLDLLTLQIGGHALRNRFVDAEPLSHAEAVSMLAHLKQLFEQSYFFAPEHPWSWQQTLTVIQRKQAAMTLLGQFAEDSIVKDADADIGYFPIPHSIESGVVAPMDVFFVPVAKKPKLATKTFLEFLMSPIVQKNLALELGWLPVDLSKFDLNSLPSRRMISIQSLQDSDVHVQYFDRDASAKRSQQLSEQLLKSLKHQDASYLLPMLTGEGAGLRDHMGPGVAVKTPKTIQN
jgi:multiple sugar transport system substrate-binding protein